MASEARRWTKGAKAAAAAIEASKVRSFSALFSAAGAVLLADKRTAAQTSTFLQPAVPAEVREALPLLQQVDQAALQRRVLFLCLRLL